MEETIKRGLKTSPPASKLASLPMYGGSAEGPDMRQPFHAHHLRKCKAQKMAVFVWRSQCVPWTALLNQCICTVMTASSQGGASQAWKGDTDCPSCDGQSCVTAHNSSPCVPNPPMWATIQDPPFKHVRGMCGGEGKHWTVFLHLLKLLLQSNQPRLLMAFKC